MSGKELILELKKNDSTKNVPVIILTARSLEKQVIEGFSLGADNYIKKPFSPSEPVARVRNVLSRANPSRMKFDENISMKEWPIWDATTNLLQLPILPLIFAACYCFLCSRSTREPNGSPARSDSVCSPSRY